MKEEGNQDAGDKKFQSFFSGQSDELMFSRSLLIPLLYLFLLLLPILLPPPRLGSEDPEKWISVWGEKRRLMTKVENPFSFFFVGGGEDTLLFPEPEKKPAIKTWVGTGGEGGPFPPSVVPVN